MSLSYYSFIKPDVFFSFPEEKNKNKVLVIIDPLERGIGETVGNTLRRMMFDYLPGVAIFAYQINEILTPQDQNALLGVTEDVMEIGANLSEIILEAGDDLFQEKNEIEGSLTTNGKGTVYAEQFIFPLGVKIINPKHEIAHVVSEKVKLEIKVFVRKGRGYLDDKEIHSNLLGGRKGIIPMMSVSFSPVKKFGFTVDDTSFGLVNIEEKLTINLETNGSLAGEEVFSIASHFLIEHFKLFSNLKTKLDDIFVTPKVEKKDDFTKQDIVILGINPKIIQRLYESGITTVSDLISHSRDKIKAIKNIGDKKLSEIETQLNKFNYFLKAK